MTRDISADKQICAAATQGPWKWVNGTDRDLGKFISPEGDVCWFGDEKVYYPIAGTEPYETDITFMAESREALPYYIAQYEAAQAELERLRGQHAMHLTSSVIQRLDAENKRLRQENEQLRIASGDMQRVSASLERIQRHEAHGEA